MRQYTHLNFLFSPNTAYTSLILVTGFLSQAPLALVVVPLYIAARSAQEVVLRIHCLMTLT